MKVKLIFCMAIIMLVRINSVFCMDMNEEQMYSAVNEHYSSQLNSLDESMRTHTYRLFMMACGATLCKLYLTPSWSALQAAYENGTWEWGKLIGTCAFGLFSSQETLALFNDILAAGRLHQERELLYAKIRSAQQGQNFLEQAEELIKNTQDVDTEGDGALQEDIAGNE